MGTNKGKLIKTLILTLLLSAVVETVSAGSDTIPAPKTTYSRENGFYTEGFIPFSAPREKADALLWDFAGFEDWLLDGLTRNDPEARKLTCTLNSMSYLSGKNMFRIYFSLNIWFLKKKEYSILFTVSPLDNGENGIRLELYEDGRTERIIDKLSYTISLDERISYTGHCKLKGLAARFFTLGLYKRNIEWYIRTFAANFQKKLNS